MKWLSTALSTAWAAPVQRPALLVEIGFATVRRWSSFETLSWNGQTWTAAAFDVPSLVTQPFEVRGTLAVDNRDGAMGALVLSEGSQDRSIRLWGYDAGATGTSDVLWLADAVGSVASISDQTVEIALRHRLEFVQAPRVTCTPEAGFGNMLPAGTVLRINGTDLRIDRRG
jgi:hypothetical protein